MEAEPLPQIAGATRLPGLMRVPAASAQHGAASAQRLQQDSTWSRNERGKLKLRPGHTTVDETDMTVRKRADGRWVVKEVRTHGRRTTDKKCIGATGGVSVGAKHSGRLPRPIAPFDMSVHGPKGVDACVRPDVMDRWMSEYQHEKLAFTSVATWAEVTLQRVVSDTAHLNTPNPLRTAVACMVLDSVTGLFGRYEGLMHRLKEELFASIYHDWPTSTELKHGDEALPTLPPLPSRAPQAAEGESPPVESGGGGGGNQATSARAMRQRCSDAVAAAEAAEVAERSSEGEGGEKEGEDGGKVTRVGGGKEGERLTMYGLNKMNTFYQVCRQLVFSQENAGTAAPKRALAQDAGLVHIVGAAIRRWQMAVVQIYFTSWRLLNRDENEKKKKAMAVAERLFAKRQANCYKLCFVSWRGLVTQSKGVSKVRDGVLKARMGRKLLALEARVKTLEAEVDHYRLQHDRCRGTLARMQGALREFRDENEESEEDEEDEEEEEDEGSAAETKEGSAEESVEGDAAPLDAADAAGKEEGAGAANGEEGDEVEAGNAGGGGGSGTGRGEERQMRERALLGELDKNISETLQKGKSDWERLLDCLGTGKEYEGIKKIIDPTAGRGRQEKAPYHEVLRWVNSRVHTMAGPYKQITNFVTDFQSCHNYAYLLRSLGVTSTPKGPIVRFCLDPNNDEGEKAELIISSAEKLLHESPLQQPLRPSDILKARASRNAAFIFRLHKEFSEGGGGGGGKGDGRHGTESGSVDGGGSETGLSEESEADSAGGDGGDAVATADDYMRWCQESSTDDDEGDSDEKTGGGGAGEDQSPPASPLATTTATTTASFAEQRTVTLGQLLNPDVRAATLSLSQPPMAPPPDKARVAAKTAAAVAAVGGGGSQHMLLRWADSLLERGGYERGLARNFTSAWRDLSLYVRLLHAARRAGGGSGVLEARFDSDGGVQRLLHGDAPVAAAATAAGAASAASLPEARARLFDDRRTFVSAVLVELGVAASAASLLHSATADFFREFSRAADERTESERRVAHDAVAGDTHGSRGVAHGPRGQGAAAAAAQQQQQQQQQQRVSAAVVARFDSNELALRLREERQQHTVLLAHIRSALTNPSGVDASPDERRAVLGVLRQEEVTLSVPADTVRSIVMGSGLVPCSPPSAAAATAAEAAPVAPDPPSVRADVEACGQIIRRYRLPLQRILLAYSSRDGFDTRLAKADWVAFCEACRLDPYAARFPATGRHPVSAAVVGLLNIAALRRKRAAESPAAAPKPPPLLSACFGELVERVVLRRAQATHLSAYMASLALPENVTALSRHVVRLRPLFLAYCALPAGGTEPVVAYAAFVELLATRGLLCCTASKKSLGAAEAAVVFAACQSSEAGLTFDDFLRTLACAAAIRIPSAFHSLPSQIDGYLGELSP